MREYEICDHGQFRPGCSVTIVANRSQHVWVTELRVAPDLWVHLLKQAGVHESDQTTASLVGRRVRLRGDSGIVRSIELIG